MGASVVVAAVVEEVVLFSIVLLGVAGMSLIVRMSGTTMSQPW